MARGPAPAASAARPEKGRGTGARGQPFFAGPLQRRATAEEPAQARLAVSRPGDTWEREADRMAVEVTTRPPAPGLAPPAARVTPVSAAALRRETAPLARQGGVPEDLSPTRELSRPAQTRAEEGAQAGDVEDPAQAREEHDPAQTREEENATQARGEEDPAQTQAAEDPVQTRGEEDPAQARIGEDPAQARAKDDPAQTRPEEDPAPTRPEEEAAQARALEPGGPSPADDAARLMARARGQGEALPAPVLDRMQSRFGADFEGVRIHTDSAAVQITQALRAQAVTRGPDIFFAPGRFAPDSRDGADLLAHELTHTLQQGAARPSRAEDAADPLQGKEDAQGEDSYSVRPEILTAIRLARGEAGRVNAKAHGPDGRRIGWERLKLYFTTALGGEVIHPSIIERVTPVTGKDARADALPSWCGIFTWWAMKEAGIPVPDWKLGAVPLKALKQRGPAELPRKGDIAIDVIPNNHFAMVTGLESAKDAEGKPRKLTRIATINGNTAGEDNLGGQVQEKWHDLGHWDHFLDPVGKLSLPPAPLVTVARTPDVPDAKETPQPAAAEDPAAKAAEEAQAAEKATALGALEGEVAPAPQEGALDAARLPQADLTLPPPADPGPPEAVAQVAAVALDGSSDQATAAWLGAGPSAMAAAQPALAGAVSGKLAAEAQEVKDAPPELAARTAGLDDIPMADPQPAALPEGEVDAALSPDDPGALDPATADAPPAFTAGAEGERKLDEEDSGSFWDAFTSFLRKFTDDIATTDPGTGTSAGPAPGVDLSGDADAGRMGTQKADAALAVSAARDAQVTAFADHPGQGAIQPRAVDETFAATPMAEAPAPLEDQPDPGMADYVAAPLPEDVRQAADSRIAKRLDASLAQPKADAAAAATARDTERADAERTAAEEAAKINTDADAAQRKAVIDNRAKVAALQGEGMAEAHGAVDDFNRKAATEEATARKDIAGHVRAEEGKARDRISEGETEATRLKTEAETKAAEEKRKLKEAQKDDSWWDKVKSAVKAAVKAITKAIDSIFTALRKAVAKVIEVAKNAAISLINTARTWVVDKINRFRDWAKEQVDTYLKDSFPGLAKRINGAIDTVADAAVTVVNTVADGAIAAVEFVASTLAKALDRILGAFQTALKTAVRVAGALAVGDFAEALRAAIEGACEIAGVDSKPVFDFFDRAGKAIMSILKDPVTFIGNLFGAVGAGIGGFFDRIRTHLISGVIGWLTGALAEVQLTGPFEFTLSGILKIVLQVLGLTYESIKAKVIRAYPPAATVFNLVEQGFEIVKKLVTEGPMALLDDIVAHLGDVKEMVLGAIREWLIVTAIKEGIVWLLALTNPASAIVKAIKLVFDLVMFLVERFNQIKDFVMSIYNAVAAVASGNFAAVTKFVEDALARSIPVLISLLASVLGLGSIAAKVKSVIEKVTKPINKVIDAVVKKIVAFAKKIVAKVKGAGAKAKKKAKETIEKIATWWKERRKFKSADGGDHKIFYKGTAEKADLWVASDEQLISDFLTARQKDPKSSEQEVKAAKAAAKLYKTVLGHETELEKKRKAREKVPSTDKVAYRAATSAVNAEIRAFRTALDDLSQVLKSMNFGDESDAMVQTQVSWTGKGAKNATALPLTFLSGNTKGSGPGADPPGWDHAVKLDTKPDGSSASTWVRGHLLNDNLHGPGIAQNLVPITKDMNSQMESRVEGPAKDAIRQKGKLFFYRTEVTFWSDPAPVGHFPKKIEVTWGTARRVSADKTRFEEAKARPTVTIDMKTKPEATAAGYVPSINGGSATQLELAIRRHGPVTGYFVNDVLLADFADHGAFTSKTDMRDRLYTDVRLALVKTRGASVAADRRGYVNATYDAIGAGDVKV